MYRLVAVMVLTGLLAGCGGKNPARLTVIPTTVKVEITPALDWMRASLAGCAQQQAGVSLTVNSAAQADQSLADADVLLRMTGKLPSEGYAVEIGVDSLVVVVGQSSSINSLDRDMLTRIYSGTSDNLLHPRVYPHGDDAQLLADTTLLQGVLVDPLVEIVPGPEALLEVFRKDPATIGYLPQHWLDSTIKKVELVDIPADELSVPILAVTQAEPGGAIRDLFLCVKDAIK